jgi:hypothetical protein
MVIAYVTLIEGLKRNSLGHVFKNGQPQVIAKPSEIQYFQNNNSFHVKIVEPKTVEKKAVPKKPIVATPKKAIKKVVPKKKAVAKKKA